jgi:hypothetical protein
MYKANPGYRKISFTGIVFLIALYIIPLSGKAQFSRYNRTVRELNYYLIYLDHLLSYNEQTTLMVKEISIIYQKNETAFPGRKSWADYKKVDVDLYRQRQNAVTEALLNNYGAGSFKKYNRKINLLPDSVNKLFTGWIKRADTIAASQNRIANDLLTLIVQYNLMPAYENKHVDRIHEYINNYHDQIRELKGIRDSITSAALLYYEEKRKEKNYPFSIYAQAVESLLQVTIFLNQYFTANNEENDEAGMLALRKANENIQAYLKNEYIYRKNNDALPGHHVFPLNEDVHITISNSLKEMAFQINRYTSNYQEKIDSAYFSGQNVYFINLLNAVSFSHDENVDVRKSIDVPERYHEILKAMLRYDFLMYRYDTYSNSLSNKNTAPMPLSWSRYVYTFNYVQPPPDSSMSPVILTPEKKPVSPPAEVKESSNIQVINVYSDSMHLFFYDNGEVDNDTITISVNGNIVAAGVRLDSKPYELQIGFKPGEKSMDVTVSANNLGDIPPNTAYLKVTAGDRVHRLYLFSSKKVNAVVRIINLKE